MNGMYEELIDKLRKNNRMSGWTHIDRLMDEAAEAIEALQQENEQLRARAERMREVCIKGYSYLSLLFRRADIRNWNNVGMCSVKDIKHVLCELEGAYKSANTVQDYHNPADVEALEKAREALDYWRELYGIGLEVLNWHMNGNTEPFDSFYDNSGTYEALAEIDKAIGGKEDV